MAPKQISTHSYDFVTGLYAGTIPINGLKFADAMNTSAPFSGAVPIVASDPEIIALNPWALTVPGKSVIVVDIGGSIVGCYLVTKRNRKMTEQGIAISGKSIPWWFTKRVQATDYSNPPNSGLSPSSPMTYWTNPGGNGTDPTLIATQLLSDMLSNFWYGKTALGMNVLGGLGILINGLTPNAAAPVSTNLVTPTYPYDSLQTLDALMQQLTALGWQTGFDYYITIKYANGPRSALVATINIAYPRSGRSAAQNGVVIDLIRAREYSVDEDFEATGCTQYEQGVPGQLFVVDNTFPRELGWPLTEQVQSRSTLTGPQATQELQAIGQEDAYLSSFPVTSITATMPLWGTDPLFGSFITGDDCMLTYSPVTAGAARGNGDYNFPAGLSQPMRIVGWAATVPDQGDATVDITLNAPPGATALAPVVSQ